MALVQNPFNQPRVRQVPRIMCLLSRTLALVLLLNGCGTRAEDPAWQTLRGAFGADPKQAPASQTSLHAQQQDIRAAVARHGGQAPVLMVTIPRRNAVATMALQANQPPHQTWVDGSGITITFRNGVIVATRGLGHDIIIADATPTIDALSARTGKSPYPVVRRFLSADGKLLRETATCSMRDDGAAFVETCRAGLEYRNRFPKTPSAPSTQWIGPDVGYISFERLQ